MAIIPDKILESCWRPPQQIAKCAGLALCMAITNKRFQSIEHFDLPVRYP